MTLIGQIDLKPLLQRYIFANTPRYLYQHFRSNASLKEIAERNPTQDLISEYSSRMNKDERSVEDVVIAYALLIVFTFLDYQQALKAFVAVDLTKLDWGNEIKDIFISLFIPSNTYDVSVEPEAKYFELTPYISKSDGITTQQSIQAKSSPPPTVRITRG